MEDCRGQVPPEGVHGQMHVDEPHTVSFRGRGTIGRSRQTPRRIRSA